MTKSRNDTDRYRLIIGLLYLLSICSVETAAQGWYTCQEEVQHFHEHMRLLQATPPTDCSKTREDPNHAYEVASDTFFNKRLMYKACFTLNGTYIGPCGIGINCCSMKMKEIRIGHGKPFTIRGIGAHNDSITINMPDSLASGKGQTPAIRNRDFWYVINYEDPDNKTFLVTLDEVKNALYPNLKGPILFMINKFFITHDEDLYRIDRNFIMKVELLSSSDISALKLFPTFTIIRIFTWTPHNWHQAQGYETSQTE